MKKSLTLIILLSGSTLAFVATEPDAPPRKVDQIPKAHDPFAPVHYPEDFCQQMKTQDTFDFVVVGGGPAGATVARRLAEVKSFRVLLLEAGGDPPVSTDLIYHEFTTNQSLLWTTVAEPSHKLCVGFPTGHCVYTTARMLGGNSIINAMNYVRGNANDFDALEEAGNPGWGFKTMLHYFKKLENYQPYTPNPEYHSKEGPLTISDYPEDPYTHELKMTIVQAAVEMGLPRNVDLQGASQIGIGTNPGIIESTGYRGSVVKAYLQNIPENLKICKFATVSTLILSKSKQVTGIKFEYTGNGKRTEMAVNVAKECLLAAGPMRSPQILERSGIGRKSVLENAGVQLKHELSGVGENLRDRFDHRGIAFRVKIDNKVARNPVSSGLWNLMGFINMTDFKSKIPEIQILGCDTIDKYKPEIMDQFKVTGDDYIIEVTPVVLHQDKPGHVHINQTNPNKQPILVLNPYAGRTEVDTLVRGSKFIRKIMAQPILKRFNPRPFLLRECSQYKYNTEEEIMCHAKYLAGFMYNLVGTARMGPENGGENVVDPRLKVHGIKGLRVVDLSVLRTNARGNTQIITMAVAEKAADLIKQDWHHK